MRLDFNVLWVDDQPNRVESLIEGIKRQMAEHGFEFKPTLCQKIEQVEQRLGDCVFNDQVDLILVDFDLGSGVQGQDAIEEIRNKIRYKDVIFYSVDTNLEQIKKKVSARGLEGVYCATRNDLVDEVIGVFESLVKKVLDLDHTRGIVMGATSDIDFIARDCLAAIHDKLDDEGKRDLVKDALSRIDKSAEAFSSKARQLHESSSMSEILKAHMIFTAYDGLRMLCGFLKDCTKDATFAACASHRPAVVSYMQKVVPRRNALGHRILVPKGSPLSEEAEAGDTVGLEEMRKLRCDLLELRDGFKNLHQILRGTS